MWPDPRVERVVTRNFLPVRVHVRDAEKYKKYREQYGAEWTPTTLLLDAEGEERHRLEGFLPLEDFIPQLELGAARIALSGGDFEGAAKQYAHIVEKHGESDAAPEAQYWAGVARYKATGDKAALKETAAAFRERFSDSSWAKKSSVWG